MILKRFLEHFYSLPVPYNDNIEASPENRVLRREKVYYFSSNKNKMNCGDLHYINLQRQVLNYRLINSLRETKIIFVCKGKE